MSLLVTTQSYRQDIPTSFGYLLDINENTGKVQRKIKIETPVESVTGTRIKPGLRGLAIYKKKIYVASWNTVYVLDAATLSVKTRLSHPWMSDLHGIFVNENGIWVTSSLPDSVILYDFSGMPLSSLWLPETWLYKKKELVNKELDWRFIGKNFRGFRDYHANHVEVRNGIVYITGRGKGGLGGKSGRIIALDIKNFTKSSFVNEKDIRLFSSNLHGPHDGLWCGDSVWITETLGSTIARIDLSGKVQIRKKVLTSETDQIFYKNLKEFAVCQFKEKLLKRPGKKTSHWTRGLSISREHIYVGQSTLAGETESKARIIKIHKQNLKITDCFYLNIENYPETRIFQILAYAPLEDLKN